MIIHKQPASHERLFVFINNECRLPQIAIGFDHGGISESIIDNETGLLAKPLDVNDLGKKIETALQHETLHTEHMLGF